MKNKVYFISDLHLGHKNILKYSPKTRGHFRDIGDHDRTLIDNINRVVRPKDHLWVLGDVAFMAKSLKYISWLACNNVHLVMGNHDVYDIQEYINAGFKRIVGMIAYKEFVLSHMPVHEQQLNTRYKYNIHGHLHSEIIKDIRYFNANIDVMGLQPIWLEDIRSEFRYREKSGILIDNSNRFVEPK